MTENGETQNVGVSQVTNESNDNLIRFHELPREMSYRAL